MLERQRGGEMSPAARIGLPALAFTEHLDVGKWDTERGQVDEPIKRGLRCDVLLARAALRRGRR